MIRKLAFLMATLLTTTLTGNPLLNAFSPWFGRDDIIDLVANCVACDNLSPYLEEDWEKFYLRGVDCINENNEYFSIFFVGDFLWKGETIWAMFRLLKEKNTNKDYVSLAYLTNEDPPSAQLFFDVIQSPGFLIANPKAYALYYDKDARVYIHSQSNIRGVREQVWTFFTPEESAHLHLTLQDDGRGGTYFALTPSQK